MNGLVFVDQVKVEGGTPTFQQYKDLGPKNEVYLEKNSGIAFQIKNYQPGMTVQIGMSAQDGSGKVMVSNGTETLQTVNVNSATEMFYTVTPDSKGHVIIWNDSESAQLVSLSSVKLSGEASAVQGSMDAGGFEVNMSVKNYVMAARSFAVTEPAVEPTVEPTHTPSISDLIRNLISSFVSNLFKSISRLFGN